MGDIWIHTQTLRVKESILVAVKPTERDRIRLTEAVRRQSEGRIVVENYDSLDVTELMRTLPHRSRVFSRAPHRGGTQIVLSRLDVYYPLDSSVWRFRKIALFFMWILLPVCGAFLFLFK